MTTTRKITTFTRDGAGFVALDDRGQLWQGSTTSLDEGGQYQKNHTRWLWEKIPGPVDPADGEGSAT
jgi:hypothetical protein